MAENKYGKANIGLSLHLGNPAQTGMDIGIKGRPEVGMFMLLPVNEVDFFDKNPRRRHDDELYLQIKESVRHSGIQQPVHVTQRPSENRYVLAQGGNTRLKIMQELWAETGDDRFRNIPCFYTAYTNDTDLQIAHLIENEQRAEMCFWDKACAYDDIRSQFEQADEKLSLRQLEVLFATHGLAVSHMQLGIFFFATEHLRDLGEHCYALSRPKTLAIRKFYNEWLEIGRLNQADIDFERQWSSALQEWHSRHSDESGHDWDTDALLGFLGSRFIRAYGSDGLTVQNTDPTAASHSGETGAAPRNSSHAVAATEPDAMPRTVQPKAAPDAYGISRASATEPAPSPPSGALRAEVDPPSGTEQAGGNCASREQTVKQLHVIIKRWLQTVNIGECFKKSDLFPLGFYVEYPAFEDIPKARHPYIVDARHEMAGYVFALFSKLSTQEEWMVYIGEDAETVNPLLKLPKDSRLHIAYVDPDKYDEFNSYGIGERLSLAKQMLEWQTDTRHPFFGLFRDLTDTLRVLKELENEQQ